MFLFGDIHIGFKSFAMDVVRLRWWHVCCASTILGACVHGWRLSLFAILQQMRIAQLVKPRREELRSGPAPPEHIDSSASSGQPETSRSQPCQPESHVGDATKGTAASSGAGFYSHADEDDSQDDKDEPRPCREW